METSYIISKKKKSTNEDELLIIEFKDYRGKTVIKMPLQKGRDFIEKIDKIVN